MPTEAQIQANRQNAQKSTGPKSEAGKEKSRQNSLKHGLTGAGIVQPEGTEADLLQLRVTSWTNHLKPQTPTEEWLITSAAVASARIDRCVRYETAAIDHRLRHLPATRAQKQAEELEALLTQLPKTPAKTQPKLLATAPGCRHLIDRWIKFRAVLTAPKLGYWISAFYDELPQLLGRPFNSTWNDTDLLEIARLILASQPDDRLDTNFAHTILKLKLDSPPTEDQLANLRQQLPTRQQAQQALLHFVDQNLAELQAHLDPLEYIEAQDEAEAADLALFDNSKEAARLHRYEAALFRQLNQCLARLERLRSSQETPPQPQPEPRKTWQELLKPEQNSAPKPPPQHPTPKPQNEPNSRLAPPSKSPSNFVNFTVGTPKNHPNHPHKNPPHPRS